MKAKFRSSVVTFLLPILILFVAFLLFAPWSRAQNGQNFPPDNGPYLSGQLILLPQNGVPMIQQATAAPTTQIGSTSYFYWIVTHDVTNARFSIPAGPFVTNIGPAALSATASINVTWVNYTLPLTYGQTSANASPFTASAVTYDVLRTATGTPPSGACACAVATGVGSASATDTGSLGAYTVNVPAWPGNYPKQGNVAGFGPKGSVIDGGVPVPSGATIQGPFTVATLPVGQPVNTLAFVTDGFGGIGAGGTTTDCTAGGGTTNALCRWNGSTWIQVGELVPRGPNNAIQFNANGKQNGTSHFLWADNVENLIISGGGAGLINVGCTVGGGFCNNPATLLGSLGFNGVDSGGAAINPFNINVIIDTVTAGSTVSEMDFQGLVGAALVNALIVKNNAAGGFDLIFPGSTSGQAALRVAAAAGTPNPMTLPSATGAAGAVLQTDGGNPQLLSWKPTSLQNPVQAYSVTTQSVDVALTGSTPATTITHAVTMPSTGCPCRVLANWAQYMTTTGSVVVAEEWVNDGTANFAEAEWPIDANNGPSGTGSGMSPSTYANSAVITFTLRVEVDGSSVTARAAPFHAFGLRNSRLELTVIPSN